MTMSTRLEAKQDKKHALLEAGMSIMLEKGYSNTGIQEVLASLGVPKGSFYHYFDSKENFAVAIIQHFDEEYTGELARRMGNTEETPLQRLRSYCEYGKAALENDECRKGCLIGNLSQEMSDQSETLRKQLSAVITRRLDLLTRCIQEGQKLGEITDVVSADKLAELITCALNGAVMQAKTLKKIEPMETFIDVMFNHFLKAR